MKKLFTLLCMSFCLFVYQNASAQCGAGQMPVDFNNGISCATDFGVTLNSGGSVNQYVAAHGSATVCIGSGDYATSINISVIGGSAVVVDITNPNLIGNLCSGVPGFTRYDGAGSGFTSSATNIMATTIELP